MAVENTSAAFQKKENYYVRAGLTPLPVPHITGMKLLGDVILGSLTLNTRDANGTVWVCTDIEDWWTLAEPDYPRVEKSFGDGAYDVSGRYKQRSLTLDGTILTPDPRYSAAARDTLISAINLVYSGTWLKTVESQGGTFTTTTASLTSNVATIITSTPHGFKVGDSVTIAGGTPSTYNGTYTIIGATSTTFSFNKTSANLGSAAFVASATVDSVIKAAWVRLENKPKIISDTARGRINFSVDLIAPDPIKYYWSSAVDGYETVSLSASQSVVNRGNATVGVELTIGGTVVGPLTIKNTTTNQTLTVASPISATSVTSTVIKKAFRGGTGTLTTSGPHGLYAGTSVTVAGVDSNFNGTYIVSSVPADNKFTFPMSYGSSSDFNSYQVGKSVGISNRASSSGTATITTSAAHGFVAGMEVYISGLASPATGLNGLQTIASVPSTTTFTFATTAGTISASAVSGPTVLGNIATLTTSGTFTYSAGDIITVSNMDPAVNVSNTAIISVAGDKKSLTYYSNRSRAVKSVSFEPSETTTGTDKITLYTWDIHGVRSGDTAYVQGCGRPVNIDAATALTSATITSVTDYSMTYASASTFTKAVSGISISSIGSKKYRVTVTTSATSSLQTGDLAKIRAVLPGGTQPPGINGSFTVTRVNGAIFYYDVTPPSTTKSGLTDYFGIDTGAVPISSQRNNYLTLAAIQERPVNSTNTNSVGGRVTCFSIITTTPKSGGSYSDFIEETNATGTVASTGGSLVLNTKERSAYLGGNAEYARGKLAAVTDWIKLAPGANTIEVADAGSATLSATITMKYRSGWLA